MIMILVATYACVHHIMQLAAIIRELAAKQHLQNELTIILLEDCSSHCLILSCVELMRVVPNPSTHPFMDILKVIIL